MVFQLRTPSLNSRDGRNRRRFSSRSDKPQSMGHHNNKQHLYLNKISKENDVIEEYSCSGTPVDVLN
jgi:hypothetical protein